MSDFSVFWLRYKRRMRQQNMKVVDSDDKEYIWSFSKLKRLVQLKHEKASAGTQGHSWTSASTHLSSHSAPQRGCSLLSHPVVFGHRESFHQWGSAINCLSCHTAHTSIHWEAPVEFHPFLQIKCKGERSPKIVLPKEFYAKAMEGKKNTLKWLTTLLMEPSFLHKQNNANDLFLKNK